MQGLASHRDKGLCELTQTGISLTEAIRASSVCLPDAQLRSWRMRPSGFKVPSGENHRPTSLLWQSLLPARFWPEGLGRVRAVCCWFDWIFAHRGQEPRTEGTGVRFSTFPSGNGPALVQLSPTSGMRACGPLFARVGLMLALTSGGKPL